MTWKDPQDAARKRAEAAQRETDARQAERRAQLADRDERCRGLFGDPRAQKGDEFVRAELTRAGVTNEWQIQAAQARQREADAKLLAENREMTPTEYVDLLKAPRVAKTPADTQAQIERIVHESAIPIYRPVAAVRELVADVNRRLPVERPIYNERLKQGAAVSAPVVRTEIERAATDRDARLRAATAGKPWSTPASSAAVSSGSWPFKR